MPVHHGKDKKGNFFHFVEVKTGDDESQATGKKYYYKTEMGKLRSITNALNQEKAVFYSKIKN